MYSTHTTKTDTHIEFPPFYVKELTEQELKAWHKLRRIKLTGQFTQIINDVVLTGSAAKFRELLTMLKEQIIDGNSEQLREILAPGTVEAVEEC